jgi:hypothetical protein
MPRGTAGDFTVGTGARDGRPPTAPARTDASGASPPRPSTQEYRVPIPCLALDVCECKETDGGNRWSRGRRAWVREALPASVPRARRAPGRATETSREGADAGTQCRICETQFLTIGDAEIRTMPRTYPGRVSQEQTEPVPVQTERALLKSVAQTIWTFSACGPLGPWVTSKSTRCPSSRAL